MRRRDLLLTAVVAGAAASAAEASAPAKKDDKAPTGQHVDLAPIGLPVLDGRKLKNYVFVSLRLKLANGQDPQKWREKEPYFRDALVRAAHRSAINAPGEWSAVDEGKLRSVMMSEAARIAGPRVVTGVTLNSPQAPQRRIPSARR